MKEIPAYGLGTYYKARSPSSGPNKNAMRSLFYLVKNNRAEPSSVTAHHPAHSQSRFLPTPAAAYRYVAEALAAVERTWRAELSMPFNRIALVPVPSSQVTEATMHSARWPARDMAIELAKLMTADAYICVVNRAPRAARHESGLQAHDIAKNLQLLGAAPSDHAVVYIDDSITWGETLAATDYVLSPKKCGALVLAFTDGADGIDCYEPRTRHVRYRTDEQPWPIDVANE